MMIEYAKFLMLPFRPRRPTVINWVGNDPSGPSNSTTNTYSVVLIVAVGTAPETFAFEAASGYKQTMIWLMFQEEGRMAVGNKK